MGVAAVVAVAGLSSSLDQGIRSRARQLLAADLVVASRAPLPPELDRALAEIPGARRTDVSETVSVVSAPGRGGAPGPSLLVELKAVGGQFPFYGTLSLDPDAPLDQLLREPDTAVVAPELLRRLALARGDRVRIGQQQFRIVGTVLAEPDRLNVSFAIGPRVFISTEGLAATHLAGFGSRFEHRALIRIGGEGADVERAAERIRKGLPDGGRFEVQTYAEAQPALRDALKRAWRFLGLGALLSLVIGGIGVGQTVAAWLAGRMDSIAVLKCLGMRPREILLLYLGQTAVLGLAGSALGAALGVGATLVLPRLIGGFVSAFGASAWQPLAVLRGVGLGVGVAILFGLPPLASILKVPPVLVMRREAEPLRAGRWARAASGLALLAGIFATGWTQSRSPVLGAWFTAGLTAAFSLLALAAWLVMRLVARLPRGFAGVSLRHGLAALARPGAGTIGAVVALGLGVLVVLSMYLVQDQLRARLRADLPEKAPTAFLADIQPDQWPGIESLLGEQGASRIDSVPVVVARLVRIDGRPVGELASKRPDDRGRRWALTREQRLTYLERLPPNNRIVEGSLWSDPRRAEISLERGFAKDLGARIGSILTFDVEGVPLELTVTSLREVAWESFGINFFMIVEPGVLEKAPQVRVAAARLPDGKEQAVQDLLAARYPNVILIKIRQVLETIVAVINRVGLGIRILGGFTVIAGIAILAGAVSAGSVRRGREVALLKTIGMTRREVVAAFASEYALIGLLAGSIGAASGAVLAWAVLTKVMEIPWRFDAAAIGAALAGTVALSIVAGIAASARALSRRPVEVLRGQS